LHKFLLNFNVLPLVAKGLCTSRFRTTALWYSERHLITSKISNHVEDSNLWTAGYVHHEGSTLTGTTEDKCGNMGPCTERTFMSRCQHASPSNPLRPRQKTAWLQLSVQRSNTRCMARFQVLAVANMKMTAFWAVVPCSLVEVGPQRGYTALRPRKLSLKTVLLSAVQARVL
jgi:hypothetical protein